MGTDERETGLIRNRVSFPGSLRLFGDDRIFRKLVKTAGIVFLGNTGASAINFLSFSIVVGNLGARMLALFVLTQSYVLIVNAIFNVSTWESVIKFGHTESRETTVGDIVKANLLLDLPSALLAFGASLALVDPVISWFGWDPAIRPLIVLYSLSIPLNLTTFRIGIPRLFDRFSEMARIHVASSILKLALVGGASFFGDRLFAYTAAFLAVEILTSLAFIGYSFRLLDSNGHAGWWKRKRRFEPNHLRFLWWTNLRSIMRIPVQYCDMLVISLVMPIESVGVYKVYKEIASILGRIGDPVNQAIYPEYSRLVGSDRPDDARRLAWKSIGLLLLVSFAVTFAMVLGSGWFVPRFFGTEFTGALPSLYLLLAFYCVTLFTTPVNSLFIAAGFARTGFYIVVATNTIYLATVYFLGRSVGITGVVLAYGIQMVLNIGLKTLILNRKRDGWNEVIR